MKRTYRLVHAEARRRAQEDVRTAQDGDIVTVSEPTRSLLQNSRMWATLGDIAKQVDWYGRKLSSEEWKMVLSASLKKQDVVPGIDGGFVVMALSTSKMTKAEMSELIELAMAFGAQKGVIFHDGFSEN
jgi:hypothetical protein